MGDPVDTRSSQGGLEHFLRGSRSRGERAISVLRVALVALGIATALVWSLLNRQDRSPLLAWMVAVQLAHLAYSAAYLLFLLRNPDRSMRGYLAGTLDVLLTAATFILFLGGETSGVRLGAVKNLVPLLYLTFILISVGRHDPASTLFTSALCVGIYAAIRVVTGTMFSVEQVEEGFRVLVLVAGGGVAWFVSREALRLAVKTAEAEQALHREQVYQLHLFESTPEALVLLAPSGEVIRANSAFIRLFGYGQEELEGRAVDELIAPEHLKLEAHALTESTVHGEGLETVRRSKSGEHVDVSILGVPIYLDGEQVATFRSYRSIRERRRRERLLEALNRASLGLLHAATEDEAFGAASEELAGLGFSTTLLRHDETTGILRLTHLRGVGDLWTRLEAAMGRPLLGEEVHFEAGNPLHSPFVNREPLYRADKTEMARWLATQSRGTPASELEEILAPYPSATVPLVHTGKVVGLLIALAPDLAESDIPALSAFAHQLAASLAQVGLIRELERNLAELKHTQAQLLQAQKLEAVGRLAGGVAHDFNNLLTVINGYAEVLVDDLPGEDTKGQAAGEILRAGRRAAELTRQLLAFSRRQVLKLELIDLNAVVSGMRNALLRLFGEHVRLDVSLAPSLPKVRADAGQMAQMILNMALNARDALKGGGTLAIRTSCRTPGERVLAEHPELKRQSYVCLELEDTGTGIPPEALPHIFEPFFTTKESGRGTGLGLAMVYGFVKQSGGYVYAENREGGGARFTVYLPPTEGQSETETGRTAGGGAEPAVTGGSEGILLVEDDASVLEFARALLERAGYRVLALTNAAAALELPSVELSHIRLLVTDVVMPGTNGKILADVLVRRRPGLKVLFVSGHAEEVFSRLGISATELHLLGKPFAGPTLLARVREILDS